jgi:hypothetical protein
LLKPDRKPFVPETQDIHGPGVDFWKEREFNNDARTNHDALMADHERRKRISDLLVNNLRKRESGNEPDKASR